MYKQDLATYNGWYVIKPNQPNIHFFLSLSLSLILSPSLSVSGNQFHNLYNCPSIATLNFLFVCIFLFSPLSGWFTVDWWKETPSQLPLTYVLKWHDSFPFCLFVDKSHTW